MSKLTHIDDAGKANMVDVSDKKPKLRIASASGHIDLQPATIQLIRENQLKKGDVLTVAEIAGIQAAKRTGELIPLCHPLPLTNIVVRAELSETGVEMKAKVSCVGVTGVEMEALTAVSVGLLTVYDMCKAVDKQMVLGDVRLIEKSKQDL